MQYKSKFDIIITTNSPGELTCLVRPVVKKLAIAYPQGRIILVITPCQFASGREWEVARTYPEIWEVILPQEYQRWLLKGGSLAGIEFNSQGMVIFLGGDLFHGMVLARRLKYKAFAYVADHLTWDKYYEKFFVRDEKTFAALRNKGVASEKIKKIGEIAVDGVTLVLHREEALHIWNLRPDQPIIGFLPGTRIFQIKYLLPLYLNVAELIRAKNPKAQFVILLSPFIKMEDLQMIIKRDNNEDWIFQKQWGIEGEIVYYLDNIYLRTKNSTDLLIVNDTLYDAMRATDLLVTIPGTNTLEAAVLGIPFLMILPLNKASVLPFEGTLGLLGNFPILGALFKKILVFYFQRKTKFFSLPNKKLQKEIAPELVGRLKAAQIAQKVLSLLADEEKLKKISRELKGVFGEKGAVDLLVKEIVPEIK